MNIVLVGVGRMGGEIAIRLADEGHDITVVDSDAERLEQIANTVDAMTLLGNGADYSVLSEAGVADADLLIAVTNEDAVNMLCCLSGKKLGVKNTVARVRTMEYFQQMVFLKDELGLSLVLNPEQAAAAEISRILRFPSAAKVDSFAKGRAEMVEHTVEAGSPLCSLRLDRLRSKHGGILIAVVERGEDVFIPRGDFVLQEGDAIHVVGSPNAISGFFKGIGCYKRSVRDVMLLGGGRISLYLGAYLMGAGIRVKIMERDEQHCETIKEILPKAEILPISALNKFGTDLLLKRIGELLPESPPYFGKDQLTDKPARFFVSEIIREKILLYYAKEIPYSVEVRVESFKEDDTHIHINAVIYVERDSQKGIVIGHRGVALKKVSTESRKALERFFGKSVYLEVFVKVDKDWRSSERELDSFGYNPQ